MLAEAWSEAGGAFLLLVGLLVIGIVWVNLFPGRKK
jgi:hypothetical protein